MRRTISITVLTGMLVALQGLAALAFGQFGDWSSAVDIEFFGPGAHEDFNTPATEGCPFTSPDGKMFFIASNRPGGLGNLDIWVST